MECTDDESEQGVCLCPAISSRVVVWCERVVEEDDQESKPGILVRSVCPSDTQHRAVRRLAGQAGRTKEQAVADEIREELGYEVPLNQIEYIGRSRFAVSSPA